MNPIFRKTLFLTYILLLAGAGSVSQLRAQEGIPGGPLSLETCIRLGLDNSLSVSKSNLEVEKSRQFVREQLANVYPQVSVSSSFMWNLRLANVILPGELAGRPGELVPVQFGTKYNINNGAELTQILYNPSVFTGLDAAKESIALAEIGAQRTREQVAYDISALYYAVQVYAAQLKLIQFNIAQLDRLVEVTRVTVENGMGARVDLDRIKVNRSNLLIQQENLRQSYDQQVSMLKLTMGLPLEVPLSIPDSSTSESFITQALENPNPENHTDLQLLRKQVEMNEYNVKINRQSYVPTLAAFANT
ncbi:MAG: TolC family protein, partial [Bacteroidetes bacterium]